MEISELADFVTFAIDSLEGVSVSMTDERDWLLSVPRDEEWRQTASALIEDRRLLGDRRLETYFRRVLRTYPQAFASTGRSPDALGERAEYAFRHIRSLSPPKA